MNDTCKGSSLDLSASNLAESTSFLLTILSWDPYIIHFWTSPKFYPSTFSIIALKSLTCIVGIKFILSHICQIHTIAQTLDFQAHTWNNVPNTPVKTNSLGLFSPRSFSLHILHELIITYLTHQILSIFYYVSVLYSQEIFWYISQVQILFLYVDRLSYFLLKTSPTSRFKKQNKTNKKPWSST